MNIDTILITVVVLIYWIYGQLQTKKIRPTRYIIIPLIFIYFLIQTSKSLDLSTIISPVTFILIGVGIASGIITGFLTKIFKGDDGEFYQKGGLKIALILIAMIAFKFTLRMSLNHIPEYHVLLSGSFLTLLSMLIQYIIKSIVIFTRYPNAFKSIKKSH